MVVERLRCALDRPVDAASSAAFRALVGSLLFVSTLRFLLHGWVAADYLKPKLFFHYWGFGWVRPFPGFGMYVLYAVIAIAALGIAVGAAYRACAALLALGFSYAHFCDKANYLNHYYLLSLLACLFVALPLDREFSWRALRHRSERCGQIRAWALYLLRFQIAVVYVFGGLGKLGSDWLFHGEPLRIWLSANAELPVLGRLLVQPWAGLAFSWCGALFDLSIVPLLSWQRTRSFAYCFVVLFHVLTALLFHIGMFPWIMIAAAPIFWDPSWPRMLTRHWQTARAPEGVAGAPLSRAGVVVAFAYAAWQTLLPLRSALYPGDTLWTEEGFRFSWKVMLIEKAGSLDLDVVDRAGRRYVASPRDYLTPFQARMAVTQPDMILELAHFVARDFEARGHGKVRVYADSQVSFNGRQHHRFIDPARDLTLEVDGLRHKTFVLPAPEEAPLF